MTTAGAETRPPIIVECEGCRTQFRVQARFAGRQANCSRCGRRFTATPLEPRPGEQKPATRSGPLPVTHVGAGSGGPGGSSGVGLTRTTAFGTQPAGSAPVGGAPAGGAPFAPAAAGVTARPGGQPGSPGSSAAGKLFAPGMSPPASGSGLPTAGPMTAVTQAGAPSPFASGGSTVPRGSGGPASGGKAPVPLSASASAPASASGTRRSGDDLTAGPRPAGPLGTALTDERLGTKLGHFKLVGVLGRGGMGAVYEAEDETLGRRVAIKILPPVLAAQPEAVDRFLREAKSAARLDHPNIVSVYQVGKHGDTHFIAMQLVRGGSAYEFLRAHGPMTPKDATRVAIEAAKALAVAHANGVVHRDIKPANLMLGPAWTVKVADFGLAKLDGAEQVTQSGGAMGTPSYMSPEACRGEPTDARSDLYSLGATYFCLLTGRPPFVGDNGPSIMYKHVYDPAPDPRTLRPDLPAAVAAVVNKSLQKDYALRFGSAEEMVAELESLDFSGGATGAFAAPGQEDPESWARNLADVQDELSSQGMAPLIPDLPAPGRLGRTSLSVPAGKSASGTGGFPAIGAGGRITVGSAAKAGRRKGVPLWMAGGITGALLAAAIGLVFAIMSGGKGDPVKDGLAGGKDVSKDQSKPGHAGPPDDGEDPPPPIPDPRPGTGTTGTNTGTPTKTGPLDPVPPLTPVRPLPDIPVIPISSDLADPPWRKVALPVGPDSNPSRVVMERVGDSLRQAQVRNDGIALIRGLIELGRFVNKTLEPDDPFERSWYRAAKELDDVLKAARHSDDGNAGKGEFPFKKAGGGTEAMVARFMKLYVDDEMFLRLSKGGLGSLCFGGRWWRFDGDCWLAERPQRAPTAGESPADLTFLYPAEVDKRVELRFRMRWETAEPGNAAWLMYGTTSDPGVAEPAGGFRLGLADAMRRWHPNDKPGDEVRWSRPFVVGEWIEVKILVEPGRHTASMRGPGQEDFVPFLSTELAGPGGLHGRFLFRLERGRLTLSDIRVRGDEHIK